MAAVCRLDFRAPDTPRQWMAGVDADVGDTSCLCPRFSGHLRAIDIAQRQVVTLDIFCILFCRRTPVQLLLGMGHHTDLVLRAVHSAEGVQRLMKDVFGSSQGVTSVVRVPVPLGSLNPGRRLRHSSVRQAATHSGARTDLQRHRSERLERPNAWECGGGGGGGGREQSAHGLGHRVRGFRAARPRSRVLQMICGCRHNFVLTLSSSHACRFRPNSRNHRKAASAVAGANGNLLALMGVPSADR